MAFIDRTVSTGNDPSVRSALMPLAALAEKYDCVILLIRHLNKNASKRGLYRGAGSMAFLAVCRSAWLFARNPLRPTQTVMAQLKNNLAPPQHSLAFEVLNQTENIPELRWCGPCELSAADLLQWGERGCPARLRAREFLRDYLQNGPQPSKPLLDAAGKAGFSKTTLNRAKKELGIQTHRTVHATESIYYWFLPQQKPWLRYDNEELRTRLN